MNPSPPSLPNSPPHQQGTQQPDSTAVPQHPEGTSSSAAEVMTLACPVCEKGLNLRREHLGMEGKCVHCNTPVRATQGFDGTIRVENLAPTAGESSFGVPATEDAQPLQEMDVQKTNPVPWEGAVTSDPAPSVSEKTDNNTAVPAADQSDFSGRPVGQQSQSTPTQPNAPVQPQPPAQQGQPTGGTGSQAAKPFGEDHAGSSEELDPLFVDRTTSMPEAGKTFSAAKTPWDDDDSGKADEKKDSAAPSKGQAGFAEALFTDSNSEEAAPGPQQSTAGVFGSGKKLKSSQNSRGVSAVIKLMRTIIVIALLGGIGYAAYAFTPQDKVDAVKQSVKEWLQPGAVLLDHVPFGKSKTGDKKGTESNFKKVAPASSSAKAQDEAKSAKDTGEKENPQ